VLDIALFAELFATSRLAPWLLQPHALWLAVAAISALGGSLLMLAQKDLRRLLVLSTIEDMGFLLLAVVSSTELGAQGAVIAALVHALAKSLLFISISSLEEGGGFAPDASGMANLYPISSAGFLFGMLAMLGVPPLLGFSSRWRIYETALQSGPAVLLIFLLSSGFALIAYVLTCARVWFGSPAEAKSASEPLAVRVTIVALIVLLLIAGLWPSGLTALAGGIQ